MDQNQPPPYGQPPYGQAPYGQPPYGQPPYGQLPPHSGDPHYYGGMAPQPGCIPLRPLNLGEVLGGAITAIRRNRRVVFSISAVAAIVQAVLSVWIQATNRNLGRRFIDNSDPDHPVVHWSRAWRQSLVPMGGSLISLIFAAVLTGMMIVVVTEDVVGRKADFGLVWAKVRSRLARLVSLSVVISVVEVIGLIFCIAPGVWLWGIWAVAIPAMMIENTSFGGSLSRSHSLVSGLFWRTWGIRALGYLIATVITAVIGGVVGAIVLGSQNTQFNFNTDSNVSPLDGLSIGGIIALVAVGAILTFFVAPFKAAIDSLLYVDLRMRKEGLAADLQRAASQSR